MPKSTRPVPRLVNGSRKRGKYTFVSKCDEPTMLLLEPVRQPAESVHSQARSAGEPVFLLERCGHLLGEEVQVVSASNGGGSPLVWKSRIVVG